MKFKAVADSFAIGYAKHRIDARKLGDEILTVLQAAHKAGWDERGEADAVRIETGRFSRVGNEIPDAIRTMTYKEPE